MSQQASSRMGRALAVGLCLVFLSGCASHSQRAVALLDSSKPEAQTTDCQSAVKKAEVQDTLKNTRVIAAPALVVLSGGLLALPVLAANLGLETYDQVDAATIAESCGGEVKNVERIALEIGGTAAMGLVSGGTLGGSAGDAGRASVGR
ncbi:MAG: hypothetical protein RJA17_930 [Pseudomonadota bacterium]